MSRKQMTTGSYMRTNIVLTFCLCIVCGLCEANDCKTESPCKCKFDDGGEFDITNLGKQDGTALIQDNFAPDNYAYSFNPCYPFTEGTCVNAAACQYDSNNNIYYNIGDASKVAFSYDGTNIIGTYTADDDARTSTVTFICDPSADPPTYTTDGETSTAIYSFHVTSKLACINGGNEGSGSSGFSVGGILIIVFFSLVIVYFITGIVFNKFVRHETGKDLVPQVGLWASFPGLVKDGCLFLVGKITRKGKYAAI
ncbi:hypothetical protein ACF0H5_018267 [Mactra antiquata]